MTYHTPLNLRLPIREIKEDHDNGATILRLLVNLNLTISPNTIVLILIICISTDFTTLAPVTLTLVLFAPMTPNSTAGVVVTLEPLIQRIQR